MKLSNLNHSDKIKWIEYCTDKQNKLTENLYFCESEYLNYDITLEGIKDASRYNEIQLLSAMSGNLSVFEIFLGSVNHLYEYLQEERKEELENGYINIDKESLNITTLKNHLTEIFN